MAVTLSISVLALTLCGFGIAWYRRRNRVAAAFLDSRTEASAVSVCREVSAQIRTPLTSIRGALGLLESGAMGPVSAEAMEMVAIARSGTDRLVKLMGDFADLDKMESGHLLMPMERLSLEDVIQTSVTSMSGDAAQADVHVLTDICRNSPVMGNRDRLVQAVIQQIGLAIRETSRGGIVRIRLSDSSRSVRLAVTADKPALAAPLDKQTAVTERAADGSLGRAITRAIVSRHGGSVGADKTLSGGTVRWFQLPAAAPAATNADLRIKAVERPKVLLIEDEDQLCRFISVFLGKEGYEVFRASTIEQARIILKDMTPSVILTDVHLPDGDGLEFVRELRRDPDFSEIPLVVVTGRAMGGFDAGVPDYSTWLVKPFGHRELIEAVNNTLQIAPVQFKGENHGKPQTACGC